MATVKVTATSGLRDDYRLLMVENALGEVQRQVAKILNDMFASDANVSVTVDFDKGK